MGAHMLLQSELDLRRAEAGPLYLSRIATAAEQLDRAGVPDWRRQVGDQAPDFALPGLDGHFVMLSDLLRTGPVVISFFRGEWCPFCRAELNALIAVESEIADRGAHLILISPEPPSAELAADVRRLAPRTRLLRDPMLGVALQYGLVYLVPDPLRRFYLDRGFDLASELSTGSWLLPLPADFIVDRSGSIALSYAESDFTRRLDPKLIVETLETLRSAP